MKIPLRYLEHRMSVRAISPIGSSTGPKFEAEKPRVECLIEDKTNLVVDMRPNSETRGQEVTSSSHVVARKEEWVPPGSELTLWPGYPNERTVTVISAGFNEHSIAPESAQFWTT